ncbi:hypothetical protein GVAV_001178 [Gurleya vavrai]
MNLVFYLLLLKESSSTSSTDKLSKNETISEDGERSRLETRFGEFKNPIQNEITGTNDNFFVVSNSSSSSKAEKEKEIIDSLDDMLKDIEKATDGILNKIYSSQLLKSLIPPSKDYEYSKVKNLPKDKKLNDYLENSFGKDFKNYIDEFREKNTEIKNFDIKKYETAYSDFISARDSYSNLLKLPKNSLKNYIAGFDKKPINVSVYDKPYSCFNQRNIIFFKNLKRAKKCIKFVYLMLNNFEDYVDVSDPENNFKKEMILLPTRLKVHSIFICGFLFSKKEFNLMRDLNFKLALTKQANIFNALIDFLNHQKISFLKENSLISENIYKKLKILVENMIDNKIYEVKAEVQAESCDLHLRFID